MSGFGTWVAILALAAGTYGLRLSGVLLRQRVTFSPWTQQMVDRAVVLLLVAVVATSTLLDGAAFGGWSRTIGVAVGGAVALAKGPLFLVVLVAAGSTAGLRLAGVA